MNDVRLNLTNDEKMARALVGMESDSLHFNMGSAEDVDTLIKREKASKFNEQVNQYIEKLDKHSELLTSYAESIKENMNGVEIKAMFARVLISPFKTNPFQQMSIDKKSGIIIDTGGLTPEAFSNDTGEWEEQEQEIVTGAVIDCGPECKYLKEGDVIFYRKSTAVPVPFFKQGLYSISENQAISVVNEGLTQRFENVNNGN